MRTIHNQRWRAGRDHYRPAGEVIATANYEVVAMADDTTAKRFVLEHHYSGSYPAARFRYGLYHRCCLVGVAVFSVPCNYQALACLPCQPQDAAELGRFVLLDDVPGNGETWFLGQCFNGLRREGLAGVISFSDPVSRRTVAGDVVFGGHLGTIYQAFNGVYLGRATPRTLRVLPDGTVFSEKSLCKIRQGVKGWRYSAERLVAFGADWPGADLREWLAHWLPRLTRPLRHHGNHKYVWAVDRRLRKLLPESLPYPKVRS